MFWVKPVFIEHSSQGWMLPVITSSKQRLLCVKTMLSLNCVPPDVNDNVPFFTSSIYEASVTEGAEAGTLVFQVSANDLDLDLNGKVKRKILKRINKNNRYTVITAMIINAFMLNCPEKFLIFNMCTAVSLLFSISIAKICTWPSLLHRFRTLC